MISLASCLPPIRVRDQEKETVLEVVRRPRLVRSWGCREQEALDVDIISGMLNLGELKGIPSQELRS